MVKIFWLLGLLVGLNIADVLTTLYAIYRLPKGLEGQEVNPLVRRPWALLPVKLITVCALGSGILLLSLVDASQATQFLITFNVVLGLCVLNNLFIIITRKTLRRKVSTPMDWLYVGLRRLRFPNKLAQAAAFYIIVSVTFISVLAIVGEF